MLMATRMIIRMVIMSRRFIQKYVFSLDHKIIGIQFLITTLIMLMVGGALALAVRWQLAFPWENMPIVGQLFGLFKAKADRSARVLHDAVHDARLGDDLPGDHPDSGRCVRQLPDSAADRRRRHGVSDAEHAELLVHVAGDRLLRRAASSSAVVLPDPAMAGPVIRC